MPAQTVTFRLLLVAALWLGAHQARVGAPAFPPKSAAGAAVEQTSQGTGPAPALVASFEGLGVGFEGPHGDSPGRNPSDNSLAVGPDHIVQTVNSRLAIFTKKGKNYSTRIGAFRMPGCK